MYPVDGGMMEFGTGRLDGVETVFVGDSNGNWFRLSDVMEGAPATLAGLIALGDAAIDRIKAGLQGGATPIDRAAMTLLAPIPHPTKNVFCVGRNYLDHVAEVAGTPAANADIPKYPQFFTKPPTAVIGPDATVRLDENVTKRLDYEVELAVVIGKTGRDIPAERAEEFIFGYTICNDVTARELQAKHGQWFKGKALDDSCPLGPTIVHKSALSLAEARTLRIQMTINGEPRQNATIADMIFDIPTLIASLSAGMTLEPGDIIATGTPSGVGYAMDPRQYLKPGDVMRCEIERIGVLENTIVAA
jgi:2-keto-4-pentenoate hydratase/2-oxohepta-3-ene-1,7-dioic acid hydratase in catechol pathway